MNICDTIKSLLLRCWPTFGLNYSSYGMDKYGHDVQENMHLFFVQSSLQSRKCGWRWKYRMHFGLQNILQRFKGLRRPDKMFYFIFAPLHYRHKCSYYFYYKFIIILSTCPPVHLYGIYNYKSYSIFTAFCIRTWS